MPRLRTGDTTTEPAPAVELARKELVDALPAGRPLPPGVSARVSATVRVPGLIDSRGHVTGGPAATRAVTAEALERQTAARERPPPSWGTSPAMR